MKTRYHAIRGTDSKGDRYATGPLSFIQTDDVGEAQQWVHGHGGEVVDLTTAQVWTPATGWVEAADEIAELIRGGTITV